jgi:translation initiation factor RLI1
MVHDFFALGCDAGKLCIEVSPKDKSAWISEELCIGCGICVKKCPFEAIQVSDLRRESARALISTAADYQPSQEP